MTSDHSAEQSTDLTADEIYDRWIRPVESRLAASAFRILSSEAEAADALQNAMVRIWTHRETLTTHANPTAWMLRVVLNATYEHLRRDRNSDFDLHAASGTAEVTEDRFSHEESRRRVLNEIACLSSQQAEAVMLRLIEDMPYEDVAEAIGCSLATARVHVNRGREKLRARLSDLDPANAGTER